MPNQAGHRAEGATPSVLPEDFFGKFVSSATLKTILETRTLRWSSPKLFNDPFDAQFRFRLSASTDDVVRLSCGEFEKILNGDATTDPSAPASKLVETLRQSMSQGKLSRQKAIELIRGFAIDVTSDRENFLDGFNDMTEEHFQKSKILCLTRNFNSILMWSHYAEHHRGALLGFRAIDDESPWRAGKPMNYSKDIPELMTDIELAKWITGQINLGSREWTQRTMDLVVFSKSVEWEYEDEHRIYSGDGRDRDADFEDIRFSRDELGFVVFGCRFDPAAKSEIVPLIRANYPYTRAFHAKKSPSEFGVVFAEFA